MKTIDEFKVQDQDFQEEHHDVISQEFMISPQDNSTTSMAALQALKSLLKDHPWSVSDPGVPSAQHPPPQYLSLPLLKGGFDVEKQSILKNEFRIEERHNHDRGEMKKAIIKTLWSNTLRNKEILKWVFILLNVLVELLQATFAQQKNERKMGRQTYLKLSIITSSICLIIAVFEALYEGRKAGVVWQKRGNCCWFYYPGNQGRIFGRFSLYFALVSSSIQLIINLTEKLTKRDSVQFDYMPLLLAVCHLGAAIVGSRQKTSAAISIRCNVHGFINAEGTVLESQESMVFHCPQCQREDYYEEGLVVQVE